MLTLNILLLIKNNTMPIKYEVATNNDYFKHKYFSNGYTAHIVETLNLLTSLSIAYLYIHKYISLKQKILLSTNSMQHMYILKSIAALTSNYYIYTHTMYPGMFSNWPLLRKKLVLYKWLRYFFATTLAIKNNYKNTFHIYHTLYFLYLKLKLKYHGLKDLTNIPETILVVNLDKNKFLEEALKLNKNIILVSNDTLSNFSSVNIVKIVTKSKTFVLVHFILKIIITAILHGILQ